MSSSLPTGGSGVGRARLSKCTRLSLSESAVEAGPHFSSKDPDAETLPDGRHAARVRRLEREAVPAAILAVWLASYDRSSEWRSASTSTRRSSHGWRSSPA